jgi:hypothetical protein
MDVKKGLKWIIGILFILRGIYGVVEERYAAIIFIPLGLFIIPLSYQKIIEEKAKLNLTSKTRWIVVILGIVSMVLVEEGMTYAKEKLSDNIESNEETVIDENDGTNKEVLQFTDTVDTYDIEAQLTGEYMSKLDLSKFRKVTIKVFNETGLSLDEKEQTFSFIAYGDIKAALLKKKDHEVFHEQGFTFTDESGYNLMVGGFLNNVYDQKPKLTYQILSTKRYIYDENDKGSLIYPDRLLMLCK